MGRNDGMRRTGALLATVGMLVVGAAGCSTEADPVADESDEAVDTDAGDDVNVDADGDGDEGSADTGDADISTEATAEVPTVISDLVPVPDGFVAEGTQNVTVDDGEMTQVNGKIATDDPAAVIDGIEQTLAGDGFDTLANSATGDEMFSLLMTKEGEATVTIAIIDDSDEGDPPEMNISLTGPAS